MKLSVAVLAALAAALPLACGSDPFQFRMQLAPEYARGGSLSVFGVFKDGRMSPESWASVGRRVVRNDGCELAYGADFVATNPALASAVDDYVRANGVTDTLLGQFAASAKGDAILVITIAGHPPQKIGTEWHDRMAGRPAGMQTKPAGVAGNRPVTDKSVFEVSATLYSVKLRRAVAGVAMTYSGNDVDDAVAKFADKLAVDMPISACVGWDWTHRVDPELILHPKEE